MRSVNDQKCFYAFSELLQITPAPNNGTYGSLHNVMTNPYANPPSAAIQVSECVTLPQAHVDGTCSVCHVSKVFQIMGHVRDEVG